MASIDKFDKPLTSRQAAHLLRRLNFGGTKANIARLTGKSAETIVASFLTDTPVPPLPTDAAGKTFQDISWGAPGVDDAERNKNDSARRAFVKNWWIARMMTQKDNIIEKMTLFWQNHFVSTATDISDARFIYLQYQLLRKHALGNFRTFLIEITKDPAMLLYLDGNLNTVGKPNENYGRELQELFTIGQGNYDENDVKNAAKVLTGWRPTGFRSITSSAITVQFLSDQHDKTVKTFSSFYQNTSIQGRTGSGIPAGEAELADLIDMILKQEKTALFMVRKFYRWFVQSEISATVENEVIKPLAATFRKDYEIKPVLAQLFCSQHFYEDALIGSQIKSPLEFIIGTLLHFDQVVPDVVSDRTTFDLFTQYLAARAKELQMEVFDQSTVFGWRPYYDTDFYELWINSTTLALRGSFTDAIVAGSTKMKININSLETAKKVSVPSDPVILVNELTSTLFAFELPQNQRDYIIDEVLIPGLPRYEWTLEWNLYAADPNNTAKKNAVEMKIDELYLYLLRLAEYQMG
ncbi:DUF1800 domain-containing protein [Dyadobacter psychrotolerans]|uniref:DUF1800 domain-containing protein n=1 Tax=Dyadobacter psychrotolerans TaxID=2541721 RepID=A0A4R5DQ23_9BACT|nr:DUF1800 domain-containing protein [Dyadobacter psychrotolerans]TDE16442.1 DUF1800 domain-containing protein [Dyadobacter psychrotolerans]